MPDLSWFFGLFKDFKSFQKNFPLTFPFSHLAHWSSIRVFNGRRSGDSNGPMKIIGGREDNG